MISIHGTNSEGPDKLSVQAEKPARMYINPASAEVLVGAEILKYGWWAYIFLRGRRVRSAPRGGAKVMFGNGNAEHDASGVGLPLVPRCGYAAATGGGSADSPVEGRNAVARPPLARSYLRRGRLVCGAGAAALLGVGPARSWAGAGSWWRR